MTLIFIQHKNIALAGLIKLITMIDRRIPKVPKQSAFGSALHRR